LLSNEEVSFSTTWVDCINDNSISISDSSLCSTFPLPVVTFPFPVGSLMRGDMIVT
jgi:hypothetical protein